MTNTPPDIIITTTHYGNQPSLVLATADGRSYKSGKPCAAVNLSGVSIHGHPDEMRKLAALIMKAVDEAEALYLRRAQ